MIAALQLRGGARRAPRRTARRTRLATRSVAFESGSLVGVSAAIVACFLVALLYLSQTTGLSADGYQAQRLATLRDELRRQNALLEVQNARLDSPTRIVAEASRLGMLRAASVPVVAAESLAAKR